MNRTHQLLHKLTSYYEECLWGGGSNSEPLQYLMGTRGFTEETLRRFRIGYSPEPSVFPEAFTITELELLRGIGHVYPGSTKDVMEGRVVFPIMDQSANPCGYSARIVESRKDPRKYINSGSSHVFRKGDFLYGLSEARESIWRANKVIVCEGYTDTLAFHQTGRKIAVGAMGTHFTRAQLLLLAQYTTNLYFAFDPDPAGDSATQRSTKMALEMGLRVSHIVFPEGLDPDEYLIPK